MKRRLVDSSLGAVRIVVVLVIFLRFHHGKDSLFDASNSTQESSLSDFDGISPNSTEFSEERNSSDRGDGRNEWDESLNSTSTGLTNTTATRMTQRGSDLIGVRQGRQRNRVQSQLDSSNCTLQAVFHEIQARLLNRTSSCHVQYFTTSTPIASSNPTHWTRSYSFGLSALHRNENIVNATILFPVSRASAAPVTANRSSIRIGIEVQLIGNRGVVFRASSSERFRRKDLPDNLCLQVFPTTIIKDLIRNGNEVLVTNVRFSNASAFSDFDWQIRGPFVRVDAMGAEPCPIAFRRPAS